MSNYEPEENESGEREFHDAWASVMAGAAGPRAERPTVDCMPGMDLARGDAPTRAVGGLNNVDSDTAARMAEILRRPKTDTPPNRNQGPSHYTGLGIQPWEAMESWMTKDEFAGFLRGNAIKYLARAPHKGGVEDYRKAKHYLEKLLSLLTQDAR